MNNDVCLLITLLQEHTMTLLRCAVKTSHNKLHGDVLQYPLEPENRDQLSKLLPSHARSVGPIVAVEEIFEIA